MTPLVWICVIVFPSAIIGAFWLKDNQFICTILVWTAVGVVAAPMLVYGYFMFRDPDRLHSEDYRLRSQAINLLETKGGNIRFSDVDMTSLMMNPYLPERPKLVTDNSDAPLSDKPKTNEEGNNG
jgi:hypothetical protein